MSQQLDESRSPESRAEVDLIDDDDLHRVAAVHLTEAQLRRITALLNDVPEFRHHSDGKASAYVASLVERRTELLKKKRTRPTTSADIADRRILDTLAHIADLFGVWNVLYLPYMYEGINETPGVSGTHGEIATAGLFPGGCSYGGTPTDDGSKDPTIEKWWIHNWKCSAVFPQAPYDGRLHYRFTVESESHVYLDPCLSGSLMEFVTIGKTANAATQSPFDDPQIDSVGWPVNVSLPYGGSLNFGGPTPVNGSIDVHAGNSPALGFIFGTIVSVASGYVQFLWGNFGTRRTLPSGQVFGAKDFDKIEYRFEPDWWLKAVSNFVLAMT